jgi:hypothetical protein
MGGANGRVGGQLSGAARLRNAAAKTTTLRSVRARTPAPVRTTQTSRAREQLNSHGAPVGDRTVVMTTADVASMEGEIAQLRAENAALRQGRGQSASTATMPSGSIASSRAPDAAGSPSEPVARARSAPVRARGSGADARAVLGSVSRGQVLEVVPNATYRSYEWDDVCRAGAAIQAKKITFTQLKSDPKIRAEYKVPCNTMRKWCADTGRGPLWLIERDERRRRALPASGGCKGGGTVLGKAAEIKIVLHIAEASRAKCPMMRDELERLVRETAIELGLTVTRTGNPYSMLTDVSTLVASIIRRAAQDGIFILEKKGRKFALQRLANQIPDALKRYAAKINPALIYFQREHGKLTLKDVGNWDETGLDLCAFAQMYGFLCLRHFGNQVAVPFEQSPHITVVVGFTGSEGMVLLAIIKGVDGQPPSPSHAQLLDDDSKVYLGQTATGWINNSLKTAFLKLQLDRGILGARPMVVNVDGHDSNLNNPELIQLASQNKILLVIPPSHTSAAVNGMGTQQCDRPAHQGGPIACLKAAFRRLFKQQWYANLRDKDVKSQVSIAEIAALLAKAWKESFKSSKMEELNGDVGYYINDEDFLQWDLTRLTPRTHGSTGLSPEPPAAPAAAPPAGPAAAPIAAPAAAPTGAPALQPLSAAASSHMPRVSSNFGGRAAVYEDQAQQIVALDGYRSQLDGIMAVHRVSQRVLEPAVPRPAHATARGAAARRHNRDGCVVGGPEWRAAQAQKQADDGAKQAKKIASERAVWENKRVDVREAERALEAAGGEPAQLTVKLLRALIFSRTWRTAKAKNNRENALLDEARAALESNHDTLLPPTPPRALALDADADVDDYTCPSCEAVQDDITPDENGMVFCAECGQRLDDLE